MTGPYIRRFLVKRLSFFKRLSSKGALHKALLNEEGGRVGRAGRLPEISMAGQYDIGCGMLER